MGYSMTVPFVVVGQFARLGSNPFEEIVHERIHDGHGLGRDASVGVHLLQHLGPRVTI